MNVRLPLMVLIATTIAALAAEADADRHAADVYWTDAAPVLDGKMNEECWREAACLTDFRTFQKPAEAASQQTEVRVCYDAENLYLFWTLHEARMDKLVYGAPEDMRDMLDFNADVAEMFFDPGKTRKTKIQLCASPLGTRYDGSGKRGVHFSPDWTVRPAIADDRWTLEISVPFAELAHDGEFGGTPQVGEEWGVQFCRDQAHLHEWSQWRPTPTSFHEVDKFGTAVFRGRKNGPALPRVTRVSKDLLRLGPGSIELTVEGGRGTTASEYVLAHDGRSSTRDRVRLPDGTFRVPYHIVEGGRWEVRLSVYEGRSTVYTGYAQVVLPEVDRQLRQIGEQTRLARKALKEFNHPAAARLRTSLDGLEDAAAEPLAALARARGLTTGEWDTLVEETAGALQKWRSAQFDLHLVRLFRQAGGEAPFAVGTAGPDEKIYRTTLYEGGLDTPVQLALAGGEYESFQLVVIPFWRKLDDVTIAFSDLRSDDGTVPASNLSFRIVDYVRLDGVDPEVRSMNSHEPDILWPGRPFTVAKGQVQSVWVDVHLPTGTPEGEYRGAVSVSAAGKTVVREIALQAFGFDLPPTASLENNFWFGPADYSWGNFYGSGHYGDVDYTLDIYKTHAALLSRYRVTCFADSVLTMSPHFTIYREPDGHYSFDFSRWEEFIRVGLEHGSTSFRASLSCNLGAMYLFSYWREVTDRETGEKTPLSDLIGDWLAGFKEGTAYWDTHPVYRDYLKAYIAFMKRVGVFDMASWEIYDEPNSNPRWLDMIRHHKFLREYVPELTLTNYGVEPTVRKAGKTALGLIDVWAPHLTGISPECLERMQARRREFGEKFWFYTCGERYDKDKNLSPYLYYHRSYLGPRIHGWYAWKLRADGMLIFAMTAVPEENWKRQPREKRWPASEWHDGKGRGCGTLVYPGPDYELVPGMRLASVRDGLEDYEYCHELHRLMAYLDPETDADLMHKAKQELEIEPEIIETHYIWTKDRTVLEGKRLRLAALIRQARKSIAAR